MYIQQPLHEDSGFQLFLTGQEDVTNFLVSCSSSLVILPTCEDRSLCLV